MGAGLVRVPSGNDKPRDGKTAKERLAEGEAILSARNAGTPVSEMCARFGLSPATVYRRIDEAIAARIAPTVDLYREQQNAALDDLLREWHRQLDVGSVMVQQGSEPGAESMSLVERGMKMRADALVGILKVQERRARLMGTDAPVRVDATVTHTTPVDTAVADLVAQVERAAAS
jgi:hypothetical protein